MTPSIYVFDAYGTLFDVHAAVRKHESAIGKDAQDFSALWRQKQLEYSWTRSLMGKYQNFWNLTEQALDFAFSTFKNVDRSLRNKLLDAYHNLDCYPEVPEVLKQLKSSGAKLSILSNGSPNMLAGAVSSAGLGGILDEVFSVDAIKVYKADSQVYELVTTYFRVYPETVSFQSSNRWDIAGAATFGFKTVWINRTNQPDEYTDSPPSAVLTDLKGLTTLD